MRHAVLILFFSLFHIAWADWVELQCEPKDCEVWLLQQGLAPRLVGPADEPISLEPGQTIRLSRKGWLEHEFTLPDELSSSYPADGSSLKLAPDPNGLSSRLLYSLKRFSIPILVLILGFGFAFIRSKRKPQRKREDLLSELEENLLERGPFSMQVLGKYRLLEPINEGGMATVYRALLDETLSTEPSFAVKILKRSFTEDKEYLKRWKREADISTELNHPNLVKIFGAGEQANTHFIAMELLEGRSLGSLIPAGGLSWQKALSYIIPILQALEAVHELDIIHRDINPENVVVTASGKVKVIDFGIARGEDFTRATKTGVVLGTPHYLAPEQLKGVLDPATDQYAAGVLLFALLTGTTPFKGEDLMDIMMQHSGRQAPKLRTLNPDQPQFLEDLVAKMLNKKPEERYKSVTELRTVLESFIEDNS